jgi:Na+-translocating ferredoxin:NAD+ oxidoreductase subunit C
MHGGLKLPAHKKALQEEALAAAAVPERVQIAVSAAAPLHVAIGDPVALGQELARNEERALLAPVSGTVAAIDRAASGIRITIQNDGQERHHADARPIDDYRHLSAQQLRERIALAGIVGLGGAGFPTADKLRAAARASAPLLIINGAECEPFIACDDALMRHHADAVVLGTQALLHASGATQAHIAVEDNKPQALTALRSALQLAGDARIELKPVPTFYPTGGERQLVLLLTGREVPSGGIPADIGVLCQNVATAAAIARLIVRGEPLIERIVTVTGHGVRQPRNLRARFGTPISQLVGECGGYTSLANAEATRTTCNNSSWAAP